MHITLAPQRSDARLTLERDGSALIINGVTHDFAGLAEGETMTPAECPALAGDATRTGGVLQIALLLPHGANAPAETLFPAAIIDPADGHVDLPPYDAEDAQ